MLCGRFCLLILLSKVWVRVGGMLEIWNMCVWLNYSVLLLSGWCIIVWCIWWVFRCWLLS